MAGERTGRAGWHEVLLYGDVEGSRFRRQSVKWHDGLRGESQKWVSTRRKFTPEYKTEAVELVISAGRPIADIARDLGFNEGTLGNGVTRAQRRGEIQDKPWDIEERARREEPGDEVRRVRMDREILTKGGGVVWEPEPVTVAVLLEMTADERRTPGRDRIPGPLGV